MHWFFYIVRGPWAIHVLEADRASCWTPIAVKAGEGAAGRAPTSELVAALAAKLGPGQPVAGGVNADFFSFQPPGVPVGAHISGGRVITGPGERPVFATDSAGAPWFGTLHVRGRALLARDTFEIRGWNRRWARGLALFDRGWGERMEGDTGALEIVLSELWTAPVTDVDTTADGVAIPTGGAVLVLGPRAPARVRERLARLRVGADTLRIDVALRPHHPREAVGGFPILLRDSALAAGLDSAGGPRLRARHPRTAVAAGHGGRRLLLLSVDGRQAPYSDGMTLRELAQTLLDLGAADAINLDGGGSTTLVRADPDGPGGFRVANRPSDPGGERPVANALALVRACEARGP